ncbi:hypothetical protein EDO6_04636 [Paenibacillus xylanexedens]|nr:hypothetical protein EDO6_04636 [Paenibacillus xylanexedens]
MGTASHSVNQENLIATLSSMQKAAVYFSIAESTTTANQLIVYVQ